MRLNEGMLFLVLVVFFVFLVGGDYFLDDGCVAGGF